MSDTPCMAWASTPVEVTLFEDRAEVVRTARGKVPCGLSLISVSGLGVAVDDPSLGVRLLSGPAGSRVLASQVVRCIREEPVLTASELAEAVRDQRDCRRRREETERALERAHSRLRRCDALLDTWITAVGRVPRAGAARWREAHAVLDQEMEMVLDEVGRLEQELLVAREDEARADLRVRQGRHVYPRYETTVQVQVEAPSAGELELALRYRTPCALWRPEHVARLRRRPEGGHEIVWQILGTAWQITGEQWQGVRVRFSTARPGKPASPPLLQDDVLVSRRKTEAERKVVVVEARDQTIALTGLGCSPRVVEDMPGVDDGGEPLVFSAPRATTLPSDGQPCRVELLELVLPCAVDRVAFPERSEAVHLRATATLVGPVPLLAGPVRLLRQDEVVGRGRIGFVARGEAFELGFGPDDGLRVRRAVETQRDTRLLGAQRVTATVRLYISNLSGTPRQLSVTERIPVSEIADLKVSLLHHPGGRFDERDGFLRFEVEVPAGGHQEVSFVYRLDAAAGVQLPL